VARAKYHLPPFRRTQRRASVASVKTAFKRAVKIARLSLDDGNLSPHTLRHAGSPASD
jgi:integrase